MKAEATMKPLFRRGALALLVLCTLTRSAAAQAETTVEVATDEEESLDPSAR